MERREFLKIVFGVAAGAAALAASAQAAPLLPHPLNEDTKLPENPDAHPAVTSREEVEHLEPEEVRWGRRGWGHRGWHRGWRRRHWGWRRRRYWGWRRRRYWGWHRRRRRWHRRYWRRRYW